MRPQPPLLVLRTGQSFWVEHRPTTQWTATPQALREGCFDAAACYDASGGLWPIVEVVVRARASAVDRLLPWREVQVEPRFGARSQATVRDILPRLTLILASESAFTDHLTDSPGECLQRFEGAVAPADLIRIAGECVGEEASGTPSAPGGPGPTDR